MFLIYTVQDARTVHYLGLFISMDSLTLMLASFSQRYLAEAQDNINVLLEQMKIVTVIVKLKFLSSFVLGFNS